jgi:16S rRNA (cytidine1402-2'-O)-methyltransferase
MPNAPGTLFVVATPIGNLEDITLRALRVLREVDLVASEDTRRTGNLLRHYQIRTPLLSLHEHNERDRAPTIVEQLRAGRSVALVSDAGTPGISDPGAELVRAVRAAGFAINPVPGASAVAAAVSAAGAPAGRFAFAGFPPIKAKARNNWFDWVGALSDTPVIAFEAPHRVRKTLQEIAKYLVDRPIIVGRELTKIHEEWKSGSATELLEHFTDPQGEFVFVILPVENVHLIADDPPTDEAVTRLFGRLTKNAASGSRGDAVRQVAARLGLTRKQVYDAIERAKTSPP